MVDLLKREYKNSNFKMKLYNWENNIIVRPNLPQLEGVCNIINHELASEKHVTLGYSLQAAFTWSQNQNFTNF